MKHEKIMPKPGDSQNQISLDGLIIENDSENLTSHERIREKSELRLLYQELLVQKIKDEITSLKSRIQELEKTVNVITSF